jgi:hypothetical protein
LDSESAFFPFKRQDWHTSIFRSSVHFASSAGKGEMFFIFGLGMSRSVRYDLTERMEELRSDRRRGAFTDAYLIGLVVQTRKYEVSEVFEEGDVDQTSRLGVVRPESIKH